MMTTTTMKYEAEEGNPSDEEEGVQPEEEEGVQPLEEDHPSDEADNQPDLLSWKVNQRTSL